MITPLSEFPEGVETLLAIIGRDHHQLSEQHGLDFSAVEEEMGTRYEAAFRSANGTVFTLTEPAYEPELGVQAHIAGGTDARQAETELLESLELSLEDLRWRAMALQLNEGDIVSIDAEAPEQYFPDVVGQIVDMSYEPHPELLPLPDVNPAVYVVRLDNGRQIDVPSNLVFWEPILHAEAINTAAQFNDFLAALIHHIVVRPHEWNVSGGAPGLLAGLATRIAIRDAAAQQAREQLVPRWGSLAVSILESVAPASWSEEEGD
ncbi:MAG: hypothetical protein HKP18_01625 [Acidimicrobiia bacterium]|nr:hypothetical protein [Acidimicrobiia bacterium]